MSYESSWPGLIAQILDGVDLSVAEAAWAMEQVLAGAATDAQLAGFLVALRAKGETVDEIVGFRDSILATAVEIDISPVALDIVGTGGDRFGTVNVSTMASVVAAASGVPVIKHGNRAASSLSGSSDVLGALGINLDLEPGQVAEVFERVGITFVFAAKFLPSFRHAAAVRRELGIPTVFNFLGPLSNPARPEASAVGVASADKVPLVVGVFQRRRATALVFRGEDGLDELTTTGRSRIWEISRGEVSEHELDPLELGIPRASIDDLVGGDARHNADVARRVFAGDSGAVRDIVLLNAAAGMVSFDLMMNPREVEVPLRERFERKLAIAAETVDEGLAAAKLAAWAEATAIR